MRSSLPRVLFLADRPGSDASRRAAGMVGLLGDRFELGLCHDSEVTCLDPADWDVVVVFGWRPNALRRFGFDKKRVIREVPAGELAGLSEIDLRRLILENMWDCATLIAGSRGYVRRLNKLFPRVRYCRPAYFGPAAGRDSETVSGAGLRFRVIALGDCFKLLGWSVGWRLLLDTVLDRLGRSLDGKADVIVVGDQGDRQQGRVVEAMASGSFVISLGADVTSERVVPGVTGVIVGQGPIGLFKAMEMCNSNESWVRAGARHSIRMMQDGYQQEVAADELVSVIWQVFCNENANLAQPSETCAPQKGWTSGLANWLGVPGALFRLLLRERLPRARDARILMIDATRPLVMALRLLGYRNIETVFATEDIKARYELGHLVDRSWTVDEELRAWWFSAVICGDRR